MKLFGCTIRWRAPDPLVSVADYRRAARRHMPPMVWTYVDGGADDQVSLHDNQAAFCRWNLRTSSLVGHGKPSLATEIAGVPLALPVLFAPTGYTGLSHWRGDIAAAHAAEQAGTRYVLSTVSSWSMEEVAASTQHAPFFQLYPREGLATAHLMARAWQAGYRALFLTIDVPALGNRESDRREGMGRQVTLTPRRIARTALHPRWVYEALRHRRIGGANLPQGGGSIADALKAFDIQAREITQSRMSWEDVAWVRDQWKGKLFIKGILSAPDAMRAVTIGADGIVVSNHGGRQLDFAGASIEALPEISAAVGKRIEILLDSGVRRGTDVIKALALGAKAVLVGRPYLYGLAVGGEAGARAILEIFRSEIERSLILMGVPDVAALDRSWVTPRFPHDTPDRAVAARPVTQPDHAPAPLRQ